MARRPITPFAALPVTPPAHSAPNQAVATHLPAGTLPPAALADIALFNIGAAFWGLVAGYAVARLLEAADFAHATDTP